MSTAHSLVRDALVTSIATHVTDLKAVLAYEPTMIATSPIAYVILDSSTKKSAGQLTVWRFRYIVRVVSNAWDSKQAEDAVVNSAIQVSDAVDINPQLSGVISMGIAVSPDIQTGWLPLGKTNCRVADVFVEAVYKEAYKGTLPT